MTSCNWCFTVNNYVEADETLFKELTCRYMVYGREIGELLTPHLQGYLVLAKPARLSGMKKIHPGAHWEIAKGSSSQNRDYCTKENDWIETGSIPASKVALGKSEKDRWDTARLAAKEGRFDDIPSDIYIKHLSNIHKIHALAQNVPDVLSGELENVWIYGPPGAGKSSYAFKENPGAYLKSLDKWWDGYNSMDPAHGVVIVDDMDPYHKSLAREFKVWAQHQPFAAPIKGSQDCIRPKKIIVTSNYSINQVWDDATTRAAMHRRYKELYMENENFTDPPPSDDDRIFDFPVNKKQKR